MPAPFISPVARSVPFDNTTNGFTSVEAQGAIEEAKTTANGSRYCVMCSFDGTATTNRWLEFSANNPSNNDPFIAPEVGILKSFSLIVSANSTGSLIVTKNGVTIQTISLAAARKIAVTGLNVAIASLDEIRVMVTSGSFSRPQLATFVFVG
jgi:hypothetical protein